jgi:hypothetical protein
MSAGRTPADGHGKMRRMSAYKRSARLSARRAALPGNRPAPLAAGWGAGAAAPVPVVRTTTAQLKPVDEPHPVELAGLLHELTALLITTDDVQEALDNLAVFVAGVVPGVLRCSVSLVGDGRPMTLAASGPQAQALDDHQYSTGQGPGFDAIRGRTVVVSQDLPADERWPGLGDCARKQGVHSVASVPLDVRRNAVGALNLFVSRPGGIDPYLLITAMAMVGQSEVLLGEVMRRSTQATMTTDLVASLREGATVDQAVGVIVAQRGCGVQEAYAILHETAQRLHLRPHVVAERLIRTAVRHSV